MRSKTLLADIETGEIIPVEEISKNWYRRPANYILGQFDKDMEEGGGVSMTVPDQSYTIREILEKFTRGVPLDVKQEGQYDESDDYDSVENSVDITEVEEQLKNLTAQIAEAKQSKGKGVVKGAVVKPPDITEQIEANTTDNDVGSEGV